MTDEVRPEEEAPSAPLIVVFKHKADDGTISTEVSLQGVEPTEVQTLLELAIIGWRQRIGLVR